MDLKKNKNLFSVIVLIFFLIIIISLLVMVWPKSEYNFFEIGLLGKDQLAKDFFPNNDSNLNVDSQIDWYIYLHNHMGSYQDVVIKAKLVDLVLPLPDDLEHMPLQSDPFFEIPFSLSTDETQLIPFSWSISEISTQNEMTIITSILVNNSEISLNDVVSQSSSFRMIFELWVYNQSSKTYEFSWENGLDISSASVNMTFNVSN